MLPTGDSKRRPLRGNPVRLPRALAGLVVTLTIGASYCPRLMAQAPRIVGPVNDNRRLVVSGNRHPEARQQYDQGPVDPALRLRVTLALKKSDAQQAEMLELLRQQR